MIAITILLAPTVKIFLDKRAEIAALQADIAAKQTKQEDLKRQVSRWQDPNYVKQQARDRINMVMPGETGYWVFGSDLPAGAVRWRGRCSISTRPGQPALGGLPLGVHQAIGNRLEAAPAAGIVPRTIRNRAGRCRARGREPSGPEPSSRDNDGAKTPAPRHRADAPEGSRQPSPHDLEVLSRQLGRPVRDVVEIPARCVCGNPLVAATSPRLSNGTPFPTTFYLTHPVITSAVSRLEAAGLMNEMNDRLAADAGLAAAATAPPTRHYLASRAEIGARSGIGAVPEIDGVSAGGMPTRVKCLHVLVGHSLAAGPGVNPLGDEAIAAIAEWWTADRCYCDGAWDTGGEAPSRDLSRHGPQGLPEIVGRPAPVRKSRASRRRHRAATQPDTGSGASDPGRRHRLRHQLHPPADRRRRPAATAPRHG